MFYLLLSCTGVWECCGFWNPLPSGATLLWCLERQGWETTVMSVLEHSSLMLPDWVFDYCFTSPLQLLRLAHLQQDFRGVLFPSSSQSSKQDDGQRILPGHCSRSNQESVSWMKHFAVVDEALKSNQTNVKEWEVQAHPVRSLYWIQILFGTCFIGRDWE